MEWYIKSAGQGEPGAKAVLAQMILNEGEDEGEDTLGTAVHVGEAEEVAEKAAEELWVGMLNGVRHCATRTMKLNYYTPLIQYDML